MNGTERKWKYSKLDTLSFGIVFYFKLRTKHNENQDSISEYYTSEMCVI